MNVPTVVLVAILFSALSGCMAPRSFKEVRHSRDGHSLDGCVCIVYSQRYQISLAGLEKLHPFDINKYCSIRPASMSSPAIRWPISR